MRSRCCCCCTRRTGDLQLLALLRKRRRLGYLSNRCSMKKIMLAFGGLLVENRCKCHLLQEKPQRRVRRWWQRPILQQHDELGAWSTLIPTLRETDKDLFYNFMRMTPTSFDTLLEKVSPFMDKKSWRKAIVPGERLAITLRYLASGDSQISLMYLFRVSAQAISKILLETTTVIWNVLKTDVFPELDQDYWLKTAAEFQVMWDIPHCEGGIDGKQVYVKAFPHSGSRFFGYKKRHCITFMAVSDAKHKFITVESGASGKRADANIFHKSVFASKLRQGKLNLPPACEVEGVEGKMPFFFVGDNAYPRSQHLATPFKGKLRDEEMVYNYRLSRARRIVENAFGVLTARYRILFRPIDGSASLVRSIILCCLALHNFHLEDEESVPPRRRRYLPEGFCDYVGEHGQIVPGRWRNEDLQAERKLFHSLSKQVQNSAHDERKGQKLSEMLLHYFIFNSVPWQWEKAHLLL